MIRRRYRVTLEIDVYAETGGEALQFGAQIADDVLPRWSGDHGDEPLAVSAAAVDVEWIGEDA